MTDLARLRSDLAAFAAAVGQPLTRWQSVALTLDRRTSVVVAPRQSGKSRALAVLALWWCYRHPDQRALLVSAGEDASKRLLAEAAGVAQRSPLLSGSVVDEMSGLLKLSNGSEVRSVSASEKAVRGWAVDLLLADECVQIDPDLLLSACLPTVAARPDGRIVLASSPGPSEGPFYDFAQSASESVQVSHWALEDATWIEPEVIEQAREQLPTAAFAREFEGRFTDAGDETIIPRDWITAAQKRTLPTGTVACGVDLARGGDESVCVRLEGARRSNPRHRKGQTSMDPLRRSATCANRPAQARTRRRPA
jgi:Terminase large subunit, T4likevirus-type, N-terminal